MMSDFPVEMGENSSEFHVKFRGPKDSPYQGGIWKVRVTIPKEYPFKSPSIGFVNKILHPNVDEASGSVCLDVINQTWSPMYDLVNIFSTFLPQLLLYPNPTDPLNGAAASLMLRDPKAYENKVRDYVAKYASYDFPMETDKLSAALRTPNALVRANSTGASPSAPSTPSLVRSISAPSPSPSPPGHSAPIPIHPSPPSASSLGFASAAAAAGASRECKTVLSSSVESDGNGLVGSSSGSSVAASSLSSSVGSSLPSFSLESTDSTGVPVARLSVSVSSTDNGLNGLSNGGSSSANGKKGKVEDEEPELDEEALERLKDLDRVVSMQCFDEELSDMDELPDPAASPLVVDGADETFFW